MAEILSKQRTIRKEVSLTGVGLHTGNEVTLTFKPAPENTGYIFKRVDLENGPIVDADVNYVVNTQRGTNLKKNGVSIQTSEHVLAACVGLEIDNVIIELNASEPPIMDGSSKYFVEALEEAGVETQNANRDEFIITEVISYKDEDTGSEIIVMPCDTYQVTSMVDFGTKVLGTQNASIQNLSDIKTERRSNNMPKIDFDQEPLMDVVAIMDILPHRPPFLLVDKIFKLTESCVIGMKNVTMNEPFFVGHFPGKPVMPGVLQVEAMAQTGGILALKSVPDPENYLTYFMKIDNVKFKRQVVPGDTLIFKLDLLAPIRRGICQMQGYAYANGKLAAEAILMAQIVKIK